MCYWYFRTNTKAQPRSTLWLLDQRWPCMVTAGQDLFPSVLVSFPSSHLNVEHVGFLLLNTQINFVHLKTYDEILWSPYLHTYAFSLFSLLAFVCCFLKQMAQRENRKEVFGTCFGTLVLSMGMAISIKDEFRPGERWSEQSRSCSWYIVNGSCSSTALT